MEFNFIFHTNSFNQLDHSWDLEVQTLKLCPQHTHNILCLVKHSHSAPRAQRQSVSVYVQPVFTTTPLPPFSTFTSLHLPFTPPRIQAACHSTNGSHNSTAHLRMHVVWRGVSVCIGWEFALLQTCQRLCLGKVRCGRWSLTSTATGGAAHLL